MEVKARLPSHEIIQRAPKHMAASLSAKGVFTQQVLISKLLEKCHSNYAKKAQKSGVSLKCDSEKKPQTHDLSRLKKFM